MRHWRHKKGRGGGAKSRGCGRGGLIDEVCSEGGKGKILGGCDDLRLLTDFLPICDHPRHEYRQIEDMFQARIAAQTKRL